MPNFRWPCWLALAACLIPSIAAAEGWTEPEWTRALPNADGTEVFNVIHRSNGNLVLLTAELHFAAAASLHDPLCDSPASKLDARADVAQDDDDWRHKDRTPLIPSAVASGNVCYELGDRTLIIRNVNEHNGAQFLVRGLIRALVRDTGARDLAPRLPGSWRAAPSGFLGAQISSGSITAQLEESSRTPECVAPAVPASVITGTVQCQRVLQTYVERRHTHGTMVLSIRADNEPTDGSPAPAEVTELLTWFGALDPATRADRPFTAVNAEGSGPEGKSAAVLSFFASVDHPVYYEFLVRDNFVAPPIWLDTGRGLWYRTHAFGGRIIEHGGGIIGRVNAAFLAVAGGWTVVTRDSRTGELNREGDGIDISAGPEAAWSFDISSEYWSFGADSWVNRFFGWRFGLWNLRKLNGDIRSRQEAGSPTADVLMQEDATYIQNSSGFELEFLFRLPVRVPYVGVASLELTMPLIYTIFAPVIALGGYDENMRGTARSYGGAPQLAASLHRYIGPVDLRVIGSMPTAYLVVPWYKEGSQLVLEGGLAF